MKRNLLGGSDIKAQSEDNNLPHVYEVELIDSKNNDENFSPEKIGQKKNGCAKVSAKPFGSISNRASNND
jgi:hypothetical protein